MHFTFPTVRSFCKHDDDNDNIKKNNWPYEQNNNSVRASRFLVHFFDVKPPNMTVYGEREHMTTNSPFSFEQG